jgi:hypothetical protein
VTRSKEEWRPRCPWHSNAGSEERKHTAAFKTEGLIANKIGHQAAMNKALQMDHDDCQLQIIQMGQCHARCEKDKGPVRRHACSLLCGLATQSKSARWPRLAEPSVRGRQGGTMAEGGGCGGRQQRRRRGREAADRPKERRASRKRRVEKELHCTTQLKEKRQSDRTVCSSSFLSALTPALPLPATAVR